MLLVVVEEEIRLNLLVADLLSIVLNVSSDDLLKKGDIEQQYISPPTCIPAYLLHAHGTRRKSKRHIAWSIVAPSSLVEWALCLPGTHQTPYRYNDKSSGGLDIAAVWQ